MLSKRKKVEGDEAITVVLPEKGLGKIIKKELKRGRVHLDLKELASGKREREKAKKDKH